MVSKQGTDKLSLEAAVILGTVTSAPVLQQQQYKGLRDSGMSDLFAKVAASTIFISQEGHFQEVAATGHHDMVWKRHYDTEMTAKGFKRTVEAMLDSKGHWQSPLTPEQVQLMAADLIWASKRYLGQDYFSADLHGRTWSATAARKMLELLGNCGFTLQGAASTRGHQQLALDLTKRFDALQQRGQDNPEVHELVPKNAKRFPNMTYTWSWEELAWLAGQAASWFLVSDVPHRLKADLVRRLLPTIGEQQMGLNGTCGWTVKRAKVANICATHLVEAMTAREAAANPPGQMMVASATYHRGTK